MILSSTLGRRPVICPPPPRVLAALSLPTPLRMVTSRQSSDLLRVATTPDQPRLAPARHPACGDSRGRCPLSASRSPLRLRAEVPPCAFRGACEARPCLSPCPTAGLSCPRTR